MKVLAIMCVCVCVLIVVGWGMNAYGPNQLFFSPTYRGVFVVVVGVVVVSRFCPLVL